MDKKKISIIIAIVSIFVVILVVIFFSKNGNSKNNLNESGNKIQQIEKENKELSIKNIDGNIFAEDTLEFLDIKIIKDAENHNVVKATVKNNGTENREGDVLNIELFNQEGNSIGIIGGILPFVASNSIAEFETPLLADVMKDVVKVEIEILKNK